MSLLDGKVVGVDSSSGATLWTFDSGAPLVSMRQSELADRRMNIFPGADGSLYAYHGLDEANHAKLEVCAHAQLRMHMVIGTWGAQCRMAWGGPCVWHILPELELAATRIPMPNATTLSLLRVLAFSECCMVPPLLAALAVEPTRACEHLSLHG